MKERYEFSQAMRFGYIIPNEGYVVPVGRMLVASRRDDVGGNEYNILYR